MSIKNMWSKIFNRKKNKAIVVNKNNTVTKVQPKPLQSSDEKVLAELDKERKTLAQLQAEEEFELKLLEKIHEELKEIGSVVKRMNVIVDVFEDETKEMLDTSQMNTVTSNTKVDDTKPKEKLDSFQVQGTENEVTTTNSTDTGLSKDGTFTEYWP